MKSKGPRRLTPKQRHEILERDAFTCVYCNEPATVVDHVIPFNWSRCNERDNLVAACDDCNLMVSDMMFDSLVEKTEYIIKKRGLKRWEQKRKNKIATCVDCGNIITIEQYRMGATNFMCSNCANEEYSYENNQKPIIGRQLPLFELGEL